MRLLRRTFKYFSRDSLMVGNGWVWILYVAHSRQYERSIGLDRETAGAWWRMTGSTIFLNHFIITFLANTFTSRYVN